MGPTGTRRQQIGAVPYRRDPLGRVEVVLVTSRETRRWVIPKGWPMKKKLPHEAAEREALEESGVLGRISDTPLGSYQYEKRLRNGSTELCDVLVFPLEVTRSLDEWPEMNERDRRWFSPKDAADIVAEPGLRDLLVRLEESP